MRKARPNLWLGLALLFAQVPRADQGSERRGAAERDDEGAHRDSEGRDHDHDHDRELDHDRDRDRDHDRDRERAPTVGRRS
jgi:hypothetical protein